MHTPLQHEQRASYTIHLSLFHPPGAQSSPPPLDDDDIFAPLPSSTDPDTPPAPPQLPHQLPPHADRRFGPIRIDWADRPQPATDMTPTSPPPGLSHRRTPPADMPTATSSAQTPAQTPTRKNKKRVFHSARPQVTAPVAVFEKTDSFKVDGAPPRKGRGGSGDGSAPMDIGAAEVAFGIVHLFRDRQDAAAGEEARRSAAASDDKDNQLSDDDVGSIVAVLAVPSYLTAADFLAFVEPASEAICHMRMVRDVHPSRCMVLFKFRDASDAEDFHKMFNGQPFNAMNPEETCQVVYVTAVTVSRHSTLPLTYPMLSNSDPWPLRRAVGGGNGNEGQTALASASAYELPTCPVCLERMDSAVTGLMTITCQHTFHCSCLSKWGEGRCPVCRYSQTGNGRKGTHHSASRRSSLRPGTVAGDSASAERASDADVPAAAAASGDSESDDEAAEPTLCTICQTNQDLWVCLICACVGCGRYRSGHAHRHFEETGHLYSLELETQRVWDYAGDGYVHRLIQNKADGKLVELPSASSAAATPERSRRLPASAAMQGGSSSSQGGGAGGGGGVPGGRLQYGGPTSSSDDGHPNGGGSSFAASEKIEAIGLEYSYLLTSQLESQRHYYEEKLERMQTQLDGVLSKLGGVEAAAAQRDEVVARAERLQAERDEEARERAKADRRADKMAELARRFESEMQTERSMAEGLMRKLEKQREAERGLREEVEELRDQVKDLMFFLQARDKVEQEGGEDLRGGDLEVKQGPTSSKKKKGKKKS